MILIHPITVATSELTSNVLIDDHSEWAVGTTYAAGTKVRKTAVLETWESVAGGNLGNDPVTTDDRVSETPAWIYLNKVNRWLMFDEFVGTQTENAEEIDVTIVHDAIIDGMAIQEVDCTEIQVIVTDPIEGIVYDETYEMIDDSVDDYYEYFFSEYIVKRNLTLLDLPPYPDATVRIIMTETGGTAKCGNLVMGQQRYIGATQYSPRIGIIDYSRKVIDDFGRAYLNQGRFAKRGSFSLWIENTSVDYVQRELAAIRGVPTVFVGDSQDAFFQSMTIFGFYRDFEITIPYPTMSTCSLEVEGFI